jgi:hypothetical protein
MTSSVVKKFWQWFECHAQTYQSVFLLTTPEFKYWVYEMYTRLKTYCYSDLYMDIIIDEHRGTAAIIFTGISGVHIFAPDKKEKGKAAGLHGWQMVVLHCSLPSDYKYEQAAAQLKEELLDVEIRPFQPRFEGGTCQIKVYVGEEEDITEDFSMQMGEMVFRLVESEGAELKMASLDFNYIEDAPAVAQQGLVGISIMPCLPEVNRGAEPIANDKERSLIERS